MAAEVLNAIEKRFRIVEIPGEKEYISLRASVSNEQEAQEFVNIISSCTKSDWIILRNLKSPERYALVCHYYFKIYV